MRLVLPTDVSPWINTGRFLERDAIRKTTYTVLAQDKWAVSGQRGELGLSRVLAVQASISRSRPDQIGFIKVCRSWVQTIFDYMYPTTCLDVMSEWKASFAESSRNLKRNKRSFAQNVCRALLSSPLKYPQILVRFEIDWCKASNSCNKRRQLRQRIITQGKYTRTEEESESHQFELDVSFIGRSIISQI